MYRNTFALSTFFFFSTRKKKNFILLFLWYTDQYYELAMNSLQLPKLTLISYFAHTYGVRGTSSIELPNIIFIRPGKKNGVSYKELRT